MLSPNDNQNNANEDLYELIGIVDKRKYFCCSTKMSQTFLSACVLLCLINIVAAAAWNYTFGTYFSVFFGLILSMQIYDNRNGDGYLTGSACWKLSFQMAQIFFALWVFIMIVIRFVGYSPSFEGSLPEECKIIGCTRVSSDGKTARYGLDHSPPLLNTSFSGAMEPIRDYMGQLLYTDVQGSTDTFARCRAVSEFLGFPDDTGIQLYCTETNQVEVWIFAQQRIGTNDFWVNDNRTRLLVEYINSFNFEQGFCNFTLLSQFN